MFSSYHKVCCKRKSWIEGFMQDAPISSMLFVLFMCNIFYFSNWTPFLSQARREAPTSLYIYIHIYHKVLISFHEFSYWLTYLVQCTLSFIIMRHTQTLTSWLKVFLELWRWWNNSILCALKCSISPYLKNRSVHVSFWQTFGLFTTPDISMWIFESLGPIWRKKVATLT